MIISLSLFVKNFFISLGVIYSQVYQTFLGFDIYIDPHEYYTHWIFLLTTCLKPELRTGVRIIWSVPGLKIENFASGSFFLSRSQNTRIQTWKVGSGLGIRPAFPGMFLIISLYALKGAVLVRAGRLEDILRRQKKDVTQLRLLIPGLCMKCVQMLIVITTANFAVNDNIMPNDRQSQAYINPGQVEHFLQANVMILNNLSLI